MPDPTPELRTGNDGVHRCWWCGADPLYVAYHDDEWGRPVTDDHRLFEKVCLEGFQSGLSWLTILKKRENFRNAFRDFDMDAVARFTSRSVERLLGDAGIVRHRGKIESTINNAKRAREVRDEFGTLATYFHEMLAPQRSPRAVSRDAMPAKTDASAALSKDLKRRGWSFVGPTTMYAFMQAVGFVNDHLEGCDFRKRVETDRRAALNLA